MQAPHSLPPPEPLAVAPRKAVQWVTEETCCNSCSRGVAAADIGNFDLGRLGCVWARGIREIRVQSVENTEGLSEVGPPSSPLRLGVLCLRENVGSGAGESAALCLLCQHGNACRSIFGHGRVCLGTWQAAWICHDLSIIFWEEAASCCTGRRKEGKRRCSGNEVQSRGMAARETGCLHRARVSPSC